jgi:uncharacterized protein
VKVTFILFAKLPILGEVKTRIASVAGKKYALELYSKLLNRTLHSATTAAQELIAQGVDTELLWCFSGDWQRCVQAASATPSELVMEFYRTPAKTFAQIESDDLGSRMHASLFATRGARLLFGSDVPGLSVDRLVHAAKRLLATEPESWLVNPTLDGGYCLIGTNTAKLSVPSVFESMPWSTQSVMAMTRQRLSEITAPLIELPLLADVDTYQDAEEYLKAGDLA